MRPPLDLAPPVSGATRRRRIITLAVSVGVHVLLVVVGVIEPWFPNLPQRESTPVVTRDTIPLALFQKPPSQPRLPVRPEAPKRVAKPNEAPVVAAPPERLPQPSPQPADSGVTPVAPPAPTPDVAAQEPRAPMGRIGPELGDGRLWVRPLPLPPRELARRLMRSQAELVDSAVTVVIQSFLDSIANDPSSRGVPMPNWTGDIAGKKFGIDSTSIYVAGLKIPAAVLALLPIPAGNIDQNQANSRLMELRADIEQAARRADNLTEFKERIREIRLRKEREEEFARHRKEAPPSPEQPPPPPSRDSAQQAIKPDAAQR